MILTERRYARARVYDPRASKSRRAHAPERTKALPAKTMAPLRFSVDVIMQRTTLHDRWGSERWEPIGVEIAESAITGVSALGSDAQTQRWRFCGYSLELHRSEAEGYFLNISAPDPKVFVMWRMLEPEARTAEGPAAEPRLVTVSYNEAARMIDGGEQVDAVPLPPELRAWMEPFVAEHYKPEPKRKMRRRDPLRDEGSAAPRQLPDKNPRS